MGAPELPGDPGEEDVHSIQANVQHPPLPSDDSDNEMNTLDAYNGYQPLAISDNVNDVTMDDNDSEDDDSEELMQFVDSASAVEHGGINANLPEVESADAEMERQIWSQPRPKELQLELDNTKTTQVNK